MSRGLICGHAHRWQAEPAAMWNWNGLYRNGVGGLEAADFAMDGLAEDPAFHALMRDHHVETIHSREASLDDVFVEITGRRLS